MNRTRPKMGLVVRRPDTGSSLISSIEYKSIKDSSDMIVQKFLTCVSSDPRMSQCIRALRADPKVSKKTTLKNFFPLEFRQALLELEEEHKLLRLCASHWKAEAFITQSFTRPRQKDSNQLTAPSMFNYSEPPSAPTSQVSDSEPVNMAKRALELSPGPKSPSASHIQKRSKDNTTLSRRKTTGSIVPPNQRESKLSIRQLKTTNSRAQRLGAALRHASLFQCSSVVLRSMTTPLQRLSAASLLTHLVRPYCTCGSPF
jgi:hypothetical protein